MKKNIGDKFETLSFFGYVHTGTVTGILEESENGNAYEVEYDPGKPRKAEPDELITEDKNLYISKGNTAREPDPDRVEFAGLGPNGTIMFKMPKPPTT